MPLIEASSQEAEGAHGSQHITCYTRVHPFIPTSLTAWMQPAQLEMCQESYSKHRIAAWFGLEGTLKLTQFPPLSHPASPGISPGVLHKLLPS